MVLRYYARRGRCEHLPEIVKAPVNGCTSAQLEAVARIEDEIVRSPERFRTSCGNSEGFRHPHGSHHARLPEVKGSTFGS